MSEYDVKRKTRVGIKLKRQRQYEDDWQNWDSEKDEEEIKHTDPQAPKIEQ